MTSHAREWDVVLIGAGINSLGAAFLLSRAGWRVLVLDRNETPGGAIRTQELTLPGFHHDIGAMNLSLFANSPFFQEYQEVLASKGVSFVTAHRSAGSVFPDGGFLGITADPMETRKAIANISSADAAAWDKWLSDFNTCAPELFRLFGQPNPPSDISAYLNDLKSRTPFPVWEKLRGILQDSLRENLSDRFESEEVRALIAAWGLHPDHAPDIPGGLTYPFIETNLDARQGISIVKGGSGRLIDALAELIEEAGGEVRGSTNVDQIIVDGGCATGVRLSGGEIIQAGRGVVASVTPQALAKLVETPLPERELKVAQNWRHGPGTMMIHLALSDLPEWHAADARESFYVHIAPSLDHMARTYKDAVNGTLSAEPFCVVAQPTIYDPSRAPEGKHILWIMVRCVPAEIAGDAPGQIKDKIWTSAAKTAFADRVLDLMEDHAPGLRSSILGMVVHSPNDLQNLNPNLVGGDINGGSCHLDQFFGLRPFPRQPHHRMAIDGLYMCGASIWPGAGASPGSGVFVAETLLNQEI